MLPGLYSVIVPLPSVVVVVVVVSETWPHANGATHAKAILNTILFIFSPLLVELRQSSFALVSMLVDSRNLPLYPDSDWICGVDVLLCVL